MYATQSCAGLLCKRDNGDVSDTVGDLLITGIEPTVNGIIVDVSFTHPITAKGATKQHSHSRTGHAASLTDNNVSVLEANPRESYRAITGRFYTRYTRHLSLTPVRTLADGFIGATRDERSRMHRPHTKK